MIRPKRVSRLLLAFGLALACGLAAARAETPDPQMRAQVMAAARKCRADIDRFCAGISPGGGRIAMCLSGHAGDLTPQCRDAMASVKAARTPVPSAN